jgi:hypothetical protein
MKRNFLYLEVAKVLREGHIARTISHWTHIIKIILNSPQYTEKMTKVTITVGQRRRYSWFAIRDEVVEVGVQQGCG